MLLTQDLNFCSVHNSKVKNRSSFICCVCRELNIFPILHFQPLHKSLDPSNLEHLITPLVTIGHIALLAPDQFAAPLKSLVATFIVKDLLMNDRVSSIFRLVIFVVFYMSFIVKRGGMHHDTCTWLLSFKVSSEIQ